MKKITYTIIFLFYYSILFAQNDEKVVDSTQIYIAVCRETHVIIFIDGVRINEIQIDETINIIEMLRASCLSGLPASFENYQNDKNLSIIDKTYLDYYFKHKAIKQKNSYTFMESHP